MKPEIIVKTTECKPCTAIGKNLTSVILAKHFKTHLPCVEPNQEFPSDFGGPFFDEKGNEVNLFRILLKLVTLSALC